MGGWTVNDAGEMVDAGGQQMSLDFLVLSSWDETRLASIDAVPQFALLGVIAGIVTGALILLFRSLIEWPLVLILGDPEDFEMLGSLSRFTLPVAGSIVLGLILTFTRVPALRVGVVHVIERLARF